MSFLGRLSIHVIGLVLLGLTSVCAAKAPISPWIMDPQHKLMERERKYLESHLEEMAKNSHVHVNLLLLNEPQEYFAESAQQSLTAWEARFPEKILLPKHAYIIVNLPTKDVHIVLGKNLHRTPAMLESLGDIQEHILLPALYKTSLVQAITEGALALRTVFVDWPQGEEASWMDDELLRWLLIVAGIAACGWGIYVYLRRPSWQTVDYQTLHHPDSLPLLFEEELKALEQDSRR